MTPDKALYAWFQQFGTFYPTSAVPDDVAFPYGTYQNVYGEWGGGQVSVTAYWYDYTTSEAIPNAKVMEISKAIGYGGIQIQTDMGPLWITKASPFAIAAENQNDKNIKTRVMNLNIEFNTIE